MAINYFININAYKCQIYILKNKNTIFKVEEVDNIDDIEHNAIEKF